MSDPSTSDKRSRLHRSRSVTAAFAIIAVLFYILSAGPVTWLAYRFGGGFDSQSRVPALLELIYAPVNWVADRSPDPVHRVWTGYVEVFYEAAYRADIEKWLVPSDVTIVPSPAGPPVSNPHYGSRTLAEWQVRLKEIDPQSNAHSDEIPGLIELMKSPDIPWFTRRQAALTLGRIRASAPLALPTMLELLKSPAANSTKDEETPPSVWAAQAIALYGSEARTAAAPLIDRANDQSRSISERLVAVEALAAIGVAEPSVLPALVAILESRNPSVPADHDAAILREAAAEAFAGIGQGSAAAIPSLIRALQDPSEGVRLKCVIALGAVGTRSEIALPALLEALAFDESPSVRDAVVVTIGKIGEPAVSSLLPFLAQADAEMRIRALGALGGIGQTAVVAIDRVVLLLDEADGAVRIQAAETLLKIDPSHKRIPGALVRAMAEEDRQHRMRASRALIRMGPFARPAIEPLRRLESDPRADVRRLAGQTIRSIESVAAPPK